MGRDFDEIIHLHWEKAYADEIVRIFRHTLETGEPYAATERAEYRIDRGVTECYEWRIDRIPLPDGRNGVVCYFRDISAEVLARKAIEQSRERLVQADRLKDEFIATLSHELRNPLSPLRQCAALAAHRRQQKPVTPRTSCDMMERQLGHLVRLVDDLLDVSRISRGAFELRRERVTVDAIARSAVETTEPFIKAGEHRLTVSLPQEPLLAGRRPDSPRAGPRRTSSTTPPRIRHRGGESALSCLPAARRRRDLGSRQRGPASGPMRWRAIFEMFSRGDRANSREEGGLGIGLTLGAPADRDARRNAWRPRATAPARAVNSPCDSRSSMHRRSEPMRERAQPRPAIARRRVLIVDDNRDAAESLRLCFDSLGVDVDRGYDGRAALEAARIHRPVSCCSTSACRV